MKPLIFAMLLAVVACGCKKKQVVVAPDDIDPVISTCALRLKHIAQAKQNWAAKFSRSADDTPTEDDLTPFMRGFSLCPAGGVYTIGKVGEPPHCSIPAHQAAFEALMTNAPPAQ